MRISYNWLKSYIKTELTPFEIADRLTNSGLEVEGIEPVEQVRGGLEGLVIGKVIKTWAHPNADRLTMTRVDIGEEELLEIVCGAPNVAEGQKVVVATVGTTLYPIEGEPFKIRKGKIRGEHSYGMLCAEDEIGLGKNHDGIIVLDPKARVGTLAAEHYQIEKDYAIEIGLTPNRTDGMSHIGVARDLAAVLSVEYQEKVPIEWPDLEAFAIEIPGEPIKVRVENTDACPRYSGLCLKSIQVGESPDWLKQYLQTIGLSPINNVVDITNFVLHETGQPLHAFDASKIAGREVIVQTLPEGTPFVTLDEQERKLTSTDLMICDRQQGMCIGGVFGGLHSGISYETTEVFLESAYFDPVWIRKTTKHHGLSTDSSFRFERGVDPDLTLFALKRAALLLKEYAGAVVASDIVDIYPKPVLPKKVVFNKDRADRLIGKALEADKIRFILDALDIRILYEKGQEWELEIPAYRHDVTREADVVEEVLRIYGFNNVPIPEKLNSSLSYTPDVDEERSIRRLIEMMLSRGYSEIMCNSLSADKYYVNAESKFLDTHKLVKIINPLSSDLNVMRQTLLFGGLETIAYNCNRQTHDLKLVEFGNVYLQEERFNEQFRMGLFITGEKGKYSWNVAAAKMSFFDAKFELEAILHRFKLKGSLTIKQEVPDIFMAGLTYFLGEKELAYVGAIHPKYLRLFGIDQDVYFVDLSLDLLFNKTNRSVTYADLPKYPFVRRDLSLLVDQSIQFRQIQEIAFKVARKYLLSVDLFDVYEGKNIQAEKKSYAVSFVLQDRTKTLNDKTIEKIMAQLTDAFQNQLGAQLRA
jgi:phenylalanyl-tRNA synthetase beta chain